MKDTKLYFLCLLISSLLFLFAGCGSFPKFLNANFQLAGKNNLAYNPYLLA
jgi:starvation-inducible outer membrane lipoprotein